MKPLYPTVFLLLISGTILSACTRPNPQQDQMLQLGSSSNQNAQTELSDVSVNLTDLSEPSKSIENKGDTTMPNEKTLKDFDTIEASQVTLQTTKGDITFEIYTDAVPLTAQNFLNLAQDGFYDGIVFHRVIEDFMAQAGDPLTKEPGKESMWGTGGPGYVIADEFVSDLTHDSAGVVSMANKGVAKTGGSQFFITFEPTPWLDGKHTVFGKVTEGLDVLMTIEKGDVINAVTFK